MYFVSAPLKSVIVHAIYIEAICKESTELCIAWQAFLEWMTVVIYNGAVYLSSM